MKEQYKNLSYAELVKLFNKKRKELIELNKIIKDIDKQIGIKSDWGYGNYKRHIGGYKK
jgi:DNA-directed RNA polymerase delta subunit